MSTTKTSLLDTASRWIDMALKAGAKEARVSIGDGRERSISIQDGAVDKLVESGSREAELTVFIDGRTAGASSSDLSANTLKKLAANAVARAKLSGSDPHAGLPEVKPLEKDGKALGLYCPSVGAFSAAEMIAYAKKMESIGLADDRISRSGGAGMSTWEGQVALAASNGFAGSYEKSHCSAYVSLQAGAGDDLVQDAWYASRLSMDGFPTAEAIAKKAVHRVTRLIGAKKVETRNVPVVLEPTMTSGLLRFVYACISGRSVDRRQTFLADSLGKKVGNDLVTIVDDGLLIGGLGSAPFDGEGIPRRRTPVIEKGVLRNFLMDVTTARKLKMSPTGNSGGPSNLYWEKGTSKPEDIIASVDKGLLLTGTMGQGEDPTTGDISKGAFGLWIEKGEIAYPVSEITISANLKNLLNNVEMVGTDLVFDRSVCGPTVKFAEATVGGR